MPTVAASELASQYWEPGGVGPATQADLSTWAGLSAGGAPGPTIGAGGNFTSNAIAAPGFKALALGVKSTQTGNITIQRFLDKAGLVPVGAQLTAALVANTAQWLIANDSTPFQSFVFTITNTSGSSATISNFGLLAQSY